MANNWEHVPRSGSFLKALVQSTLVVTPEQRKRICRVDTKHKNDRLVTDGPTMGECDSDAPCISKVCGFKKKKKVTL